MNDPKPPPNPIPDDDQIPPPPLSDEDRAILAYALGVASAFILHTFPSKMDLTLRLGNMATNLK